MGNESLKYISTRGHQKKLEFHDVIFEGLAPDGGLYVPETWPILDNDTIKSFNKKTYQEIAFEVISPYVGKSLSNENLSMSCLPRLPRQPSENIVCFARSS